MKLFRKILSWIASPFTLGLLCTSIILYISFLYYARYQDSVYDGESAFFDLIREVHQKSIDYRLLDRGEVYGHPDVAVLAVDEEAVEQEGRWPWPREKTGQVVDRAVGEFGTKAIAFDIVFSEADTNSSIPTLSRLQRTLEEKQTLSPEIQGVLTSEIDKADSDQKFSQIIAKNADHLVLGAYFDELGKAALEHVSPHVDTCIDVLHERAPVFQYWKNDQRPPLVVDVHAQRQSLPQPIKEHLTQYLDGLEASVLQSWLGGHLDIVKTIQDSIESVGLPREEFPIEPLLLGYIYNDKGIIKSSIEGLTNQTPPPETVQKLFNTLASLITSKDQAVINAKLRDETLAYCLRIFRDGNTNAELNDELLNKNSFDARYKGSSAEGAFDSISWEAAWKTANDAGLELPTGKFSAFLESVLAEPKINPITPIERWWVNIPTLAANTKYTGYFNAVLDSDGTVRRNMFIARRGNHYSGSLALTSFLVSRGLTVSAAVVSSPNDPLRKGVPINYKRTPEGSATSVVEPGFRILNKAGETVMTVPVDPAGRMLINYAGPRHMFPHISAAEILSDSPKATIQYHHRDPKTGAMKDSMEVDKREFLKDKILVFGATAIGIFDLRVTPFEENFPGVETHANMLSNLLVEYERAVGNGEAVKDMPGFLRAYPDREKQIMMLTMVGLGVGLCALLSYFGSVAGLLITIFIMGSIYAIDKYWLFKSGIVVTIILPVGMVFINFVALTFYKYFTEERKKRALKGTFEKYVSPAIVAEVLADPSNIELGGKKMELTVMFSDVRGFTTISEKLDPRALSDLLNSYLTPMTNLVFEHKGTLDKYMGDAIMAFWGAPIHFPDHAKHACRCALVMLEKLKELQAQYRAQGLPEIDIGIGLNTGDMSVGNMGSDTVRSYTVMGDAVNLGSRLEGINKQYGTRIIVSEFTFAAIKDSFVCREVDWVRVKGKAQPVRIFELVAEKKAEPQMAQVIDLFKQGFEAYHQKSWPQAIECFSSALKVRPDDEPSTLYLERCQEYQANPPPDDWDGVFTMTTK